MNGVDMAIRRSEQNRIPSVSMVIYEWNFKLEGWV